MDDEVVKALIKAFELQNDEPDAQMNVNIILRFQNRIKYLEVEVPGSAFKSILIVPKAAPPLDRVEEARLVDEEELFLPSSEPSSQEVGY